MNRVVKLSRCRALMELKNKEPLSEGEYAKLREMIPDCGLSGEPFDEVSWVHPIRIPKDPRVFVLQQDTKVVSVWGKFNRNVFVSVIGDSELEKCYENNPGSFIYAVGTIKEKVKEGKTYRDLRPRGWLLCVIEPPDAKGQKKKSKKKK